MNPAQKLDNADFEYCSLVGELRITIQCPVGGVERLIAAFSETLSLTQGAYDNCLYVRQNGLQQFRALEGSHAGDERTIQRTRSSEIVLTIRNEIEVLEKVVDTVFKYGVQEEPTITVEPIWGVRSKYLDDKNNPNRYWNRPDAREIHGDSV
ncbi:MAG: hypothetical protein AAF434_00515 [Pseudomonadota bacterium]